MKPPVAEVAETSFRQATASELSASPATQIFGFDVTRITLIAASLLFSLPGSGVWSAEPATDSDSAAEAKPILSPDQAYTAQLSHAATYQVDFRVAITPPAKTKKLCVWMPLPPSDEVQQISNRVLTSFPREVKPSIATEPIYGNRFAYFEFDSPDGGQLISHRFQVTTHQLNWDVSYGKVQAPPQWPSSFKPYLTRDPRLLSDEPLQLIVDELSRPRDAADQLLGAMRWVDDHLTYDHVVASLQADPRHGLAHRRGHCSDYHGLCSTLAREVGYPSRVTYGLQLFDKASPSHCKLEVFLPPYGWVSYDLSETQKMTQEHAAADGLSEQQKRQRANAIRSRTKAGFRENSWLLMTRGTNYALAPPAAAGKVPVVRTIYAEADGEPLPEPDPSNPQQRRFAWMTLHRVDGDGQAKRFQILDPE